MRACVDVGGTKVAVSLSPQRDAPLIGRLTEPTAKTGDNDALAKQIIRLIDQACARQGVNAADVACVGVSTCGPFELRDGMVELATPNICGGLAGPERDAPNRWLTAQLEAPLRQRFGRVRVENDGIAALEAERRWGALQGVAHCAYVTWSTGVGVGLCVDGRVLHGKNGNAGHAGHSFVVDDDGGLCGCGNVGDVEALVAGSGVERRFGQPAAELMAAAHRGEAAALQVIDAMSRITGRLLYNLVATLDLERISVGGSVFWHNQDLLLPRLRTEVAAHLPALTRGAEIVPAGLGERVGDYAALALVD